MIQCRNFNGHFNSNYNRLFFYLIDGDFDGGFGEDCISLQTGNIYLSFSDVINTL